MRIEVTGKRLEITPAISAYAESKCEKLLKFFDGVLEIKVVLEPAEHGHFNAELLLDVVKHDHVARANGPTVYAAIDLAIDKMSRQLIDYKERLRNPKPKR